MQARTIFPDALVGILISLLSRKDGLILFPKLFNIIRGLWVFSRPAFGSEIQPVAHFIYRSLELHRKAIQYVCYDTLIMSAHPCSLTPFVQSPCTRQLPPRATITLTGHQDPRTRIHKTHFDIKQLKMSSAPG